MQEFSDNFSIETNIEVLFSPERWSLDTLSNNIKYALQFINL